MVQNNHNDRQSLSKKKKVQKVKTYKGDLQNWGIPLTVIPKKETVQAKKKRITKIRPERGLTNPQQKEMTAYSK